MGNYACLHCFSLANGSVRLLITCAHPDYMHFLSFVQFLSCLFTYYLCWINVLEVRINVIIIIIMLRSLMQGLHDGTVRRMVRQMIRRTVRRCARCMSVVCPTHMSAGRNKLDTTPDRTADKGRGYHNTWFDDVYSDEWSSQLNYKNVSDNIRVICVILVCVLRRPIVCIFYNCRPIILNIVYGYTVNTCN